MKIEKINDNQIRCVLTREDLAKRNLRISELAYGTEKTKNLFREMVKQADCEYGFAVENSPLVVEAIPMNSESIVLIITKVDDPEELDTRFSRFSPYNNPEEEEEYDEDDEDITGLSGDPAPVREPSFGEMLKEALTEDVPKHSFVFVFPTLSRTMDFARQANGYKGNSTLVKSTSGDYLMILSIGEASKSEFENVCLLGSEYGKGHSIPAASLEFLREHGDIMIDADAIEKLAM